MKKISYLVVFLGAIFTLAACGNQEANKAADSSSTESAKTVTVTDGNGKELEVPVDPQKVVVFDMGMLDTMDELGLSKQVVGVPKENLPDYLKQYDTKDYDSIGGLKEPDVEKINELKPDLIIISGRQRDYQEELSKIAPTLFLGTDNKKGWSSTEGNIETIGKVFDKEEAVKEKLATLTKKIDEVKAKAEASSDKALTVLVNEGELSAYGQASRFGIISDTLGFKMADDAIEASTHGQSVSFEYVLEKDPDIIFVVDRTKAIGGDTSKDDISKNPLVAQTKAAKNNKIILLSPDVWYLSGGGLQSTEQMIDEVAAALK